MATIHTKRLILREYRYQDWVLCHLYARQGDILIYEAWGPNSITETKAFVQKAIEESNAVPRTIFELCITLNPGHEVIGGCGFRINGKDPNRGDFGYIINPDYWNQGYGTEAAQGLVDYMISQQNLTRIVATCDALNIPSQRVLEKCGLIRVREIKNHKELKGRLADTFMYEKKVEQEIETEN